MFESFPSIIFHVNEGFMTAGVETDLRSTPRTQGGEFVLDFLRHFPSVLKFLESIK
jgi:hypothetical protein